MSIKKYIVVAPVGDNLGALFIGIREFPTQKVYLISPRERLRNAERAAKDLARFQIPAVIKEIRGNLIEEMFRIVGEIRDIESHCAEAKDCEILVNIATGDAMSTCAALSASFVNGLKAFGVMNNQPVLMPILKFSYYKLLNERKLQILKILEKGTITFEELSKKARMSFPLVSYHVNGTLKSAGLRELGLIETAEKQGKTAISLSTLGRLLIKGYVT